jgi:RimJ/RimL family protein N-acetyltransferase
MGKVEASNFKTKTGLSVIIRNATEADAEGYLELGKSIMAEEIYTLTQVEEMTMTIEQERQWLRLHIENPNHLVLVAEVDGRIVGQLDFANGHRRLIAHTGQFGIGLHKDFRALGIGPQLLTKLIDWARKHSEMEKINLSVHQTNENAIAAYKKCGFVIEGIRTRDLKYPNGVYVDTVLMGLQLPVS